MAGTIVAIGEILVEIMATTAGEGFREPIDFIGPFPSGAPAIFIDQVGRLGTPCAMIGCVGADDFGALNIARLRSDGVDVSGIRVDTDAVTGSAFVRYRHDGHRDFIFNIRDSAATRLGEDIASAAVIAGARHLHVVGSSLVSPAIVDAVRGAMAAVKSAGGTISFDPNVRRELLAAPGVRDALFAVLAGTDLFLPSGDELALFGGTEAPGDAARRLLDSGVGAIAHKLGAQGARYMDRTTDLLVPGYVVEEIDPTGAGDIFGATFVVGWLAGLPPGDNLRRANAAGAMAVMRKGPMSGASTAAQIDAFLAGAGARAINASA